MKAKIQKEVGVVELEFEAMYGRADAFYLEVGPAETTPGIYCSVTRPGRPPTVSDDELRSSLRLRVPKLEEPLVVCGYGPSRNEWLGLFFASEELSTVSVPGIVDVLWVGGGESYLGQLPVKKEIMHVYWEGRRVGTLSGFMVCQPYYHGVWTPAGDTEFEQEFHGMQDRIAPDGKGLLPVTLRSPDESVSGAAAAIILPAPSMEPVFRFGSPDLKAGIIRRPHSRKEVSRGGRKGSYRLRVAAKR